MLISCQAAIAYIELFVPSTYSVKKATETILKNTIFSLSHNENTVFTP
jgi:hypothetical protein